MLSFKLTLTLTACAYLNLITKRNCKMLESKKKTKYTVSISHLMIHCLQIKWRRRAKSFLPFILSTPSACIRAKGAPSISEKLSGDRYLPTVIHIYTTLHVIICKRRFQFNRIYCNDYTSCYFDLVQQLASSWCVIIILQFAKLPRVYLMKNAIHNQICYLQSSFTIKSHLTTEFDA